MHRNPFGLKQELHTELQMPGIAGRRNSSESGRPEKVVRQIEVRMIEKIESLGTNLKVEPLS